jgi:heptaprenylglyceryl phosphate synthase
LVAPSISLERHDAAIAKLAEYLQYVDLLVFPKWMNSREEKWVQKRNDEFYPPYEMFRDKMGKTKAVETVAEMCGYGASSGGRS